MNYDASIIQIIESLKADKSIPAEYRNAVASSARRLQLEIRGAKTMTVMQPPGELLDMENGNGQRELARQPVATCTCPVGGVKRSCTIHGDGV